MSPREVLQKAMDESGRPTMKKWYNEVYLYSDHWKELRLRKMRSTRFRCQHCETKKRLQVHHENYREIFNVTLSDLKTLCESCHQIEHFGVLLPKPSSPKQNHTAPSPRKLEKKQIRAAKRLKKQAKQEKRELRAKRMGFASYSQYRMVRSAKRALKRERMREVKRLSKIPS